MNTDRIQIIEPYVPAPVSQPSKVKVVKTGDGGPYWVLSQGTAVACDCETQEGVLTVSCQLENADFHVTAAGLRFLQSHGIVTIVFQTALAESRFAVDDVLQTLSRGTLTLAHAGAQTSLTLDGEDHTDLIA